MIAVITGFVFIVVDIVIVTDIAITILIVLIIIIITPEKHIDRINGGSNYDSRKGAKCLLIQAVTPMNGMTKKIPTAPINVNNNNNYNYN